MDCSIAGSSILADVTVNQGLCAKGRRVCFSGACDLVLEALLKQPGAFQHLLATETSAPKS